jgi:holliday junction DNA helicase RuvA
LIAWLKGRLRHREGNLAILDVHGVGYAVAVPSRTLDTLSTLEGEHELFVSTQVREDAIDLYGFLTPAERRAFETLMSVSGIGPKLALACLDALTVGALSRAVDSDDLVTLCRIPGVGKRTAQRLALELKNKLPGSDDSLVLPAPEPAVPPDTLQLALSRLGYGRAEIDRVVAALPEHGLTRESPIELRLKAALRILYGK